MPNVTGTDLADGFATLRRGGFCVAIGEAHFAANISNWIVSQAPEPGARVRPSAVVSLTLDSLEGTPIPNRARGAVPRVVGLSLGKAVDRLESANVNWEAVLGELQPSRAPSLGEALRVTRQWRTSYLQRSQEYSSPFVAGAPVRLALTPRSALSCS